VACWVQAFFPSIRIEVMLDSAGDSSATAGAQAKSSATFRALQVETDRVW